MNFFDFGNLNYWAILVAVIFNQGLGAVWYRLLSKPWLAEAGMTQKDIEAMKATPRQWYPYLIAVITSVVFVFSLALIIQGLEVNNPVGGLGLGLLVATGFILTSNAVNYAFECRSLKLFVINGGYPFISYGVIGALLGAWG